VSERVVLHVGTMKSGTSTVQSMLFAQQAELAEAGVLVPGRRWADQTTAVLQALGRRAERDRWDAVRAAVAAHSGDAVISMEFLGPAQDAAAERVLAGLSPARVEVVVTARDLNRTVPSMWQETIQNGRSWTWDDYVAAAEQHAPGASRGQQDRTTAGGTFWRQQHLLRIVEDWCARVGADRVSLVTLPPPGADRTLLVRRFAEAARLPLDPDRRLRTRNESIGLASALVLREVNEWLESQGHTFRQGQRVRKGVLAKSALARLAKDEPRLGFPVPDWVTAQTEATVAGLRRLPISLVGDWTDLDPVPVTGIRPSEVDSALLARAATVGLGAVLADRITKE
jgi:hypothetical protein